MWLVLLPHEWSQASEGKSLTSPGSWTEPAQSGLLSLPSSSCKVTQPWWRRQQFLSNHVSFMTEYRSLVCVVSTPSGVSGGASLSAQALEAQQTKLSSSRCLSNYFSKPLQSTKKHFRAQSPCLMWREGVLPQKWHKAKTEEGWTGRAPQ